MGRHLKISYDFFPGATQAFRAHGDEFYLLGVLDQSKPFDGRVEGNLDKVRDSISRIRINVRHKPKPMDCTVSVGWLTSDDALEGEGVTARKVRELLEAAVSEAKGRGRNTVVKYSKEISAKDMLSIRDVCQHCKTRFVADIPRKFVKQDKLFCPNCGETSCRPEVPESSKRSS